MRLIAFALLALAACDAWAAQRIVMYRCTDASGAVMLQNDVPCPKGSKQEKRVVDAPPSAPVPALAAAEPATATPSTPAAQTAPATSAPTSSAAPAIAPIANLQTETGRSPPPGLYRCSTYDKQQYFSESGNAEPRCVPLQTVGLDGNPDTGVGRACEMVTDTCKRVADESLCTAWKLRLRDAEAAAAGFVKPEQTVASEAELERIRKIVRESACGE